MSRERKKTTPIKLLLVSEFSKIVLFSIFFFLDEYLKSSSTLPLILGLIRGTFGLYIIPFISTPITLLIAYFLIFKNEKSTSILKYTLLVSFADITIYAVLVTISLLFLSS